MSPQHVKMGIFGKSFNELGTAVNNAFKSVIDNLDNFDENVGFGENLKNNLFPKKDDKDWIKNSLGEIISQENIDSYIAELDLDSAKEKIDEIFNWDSSIKKGETTWEKFFDTCKGGNEYLIDLIKNTDDLSKLTGEDLVNACDEARDAAIAHNKELENMSFSTKAATIATKALSVAGNMLVMWGISEAISGISKLASAEQEAAEKVKELYEESESRSQKYEDDLQSINELTEKYKEINKSGNIDTEKRTEIAEIQGKINELVGHQVNGLDLVNGKFDEQIEKLNTITKEQKLQAYYNSIANYNNAKKVSNSAEGQERGDGGLFDHDFDYVYRERNMDEEILNILENAGFRFETTDLDMFREMFNNWTGNTFFELRADHDENGNFLETLEDKLALLKRMQETLLLNGKSNSGLFSAVTSQIDKWETLKTNESNSAKDIVKYYLDSIADSSEINSVDVFTQYRDKLINDVKSNPNISQIISDGVLNENDLADAIDLYMSTANGFSKWFDEWKNKIQDSGQDSASDTSPISFSKAWKKLGKESDEDTAKESEEAKEKLCIEKTVLYFKNKTVFCV